MYLPDFVWLRFLWQRCRSHPSATKLPKSSDLQRHQSTHLSIRSGVNSAISFPNTAEYHSPEKLIAADAVDLGIRTLRDHTPDPNNDATWASYIKIAKAHIRFDFLLSGDG